MTDLSFTCTGCHQTLTVDESLIGQDVTCPACSQVMTVPRRRAVFNIKGHQASQNVPSAEKTEAENLTGLADVHAFGDERQDLVAKRRLKNKLQQILAAVGMLLTLMLVVYVGYRFYDAREARKQSIKEDFLKQKEAQELRRQQRREAQRLNRDARRQQPLWSLTDESCYRLWRALRGYYALPKDAEAQFKAWVQYDGETYGLFSEVFAQISQPADVEIASQRLVGMSLGMQGEQAKVPELEVFRAVALKSLDNTN